MINNFLCDFFSKRVKQLFEVFEEKKDEIYEIKLLNNINFMFNSFFKKDYEGKYSIFYDLMFNLFNRERFYFFSLDDEKNKRYNEMFIRYLSKMELYKIYDKLLKLFFRLLGINNNIYFLNFTENGLKRVNGLEYTEAEKRSLYIENDIKLDKRYNDGYLWNDDLEKDVRGFIESFRYIQNFFVYVYSTGIEMDLGIGVKIDNENYIKYKIEQKLIDVLSIQSFDDNKKFDDGLFMDADIGVIESYFNFFKLYYTEDNVEKESIYDTIYTKFENNILDIVIEVSNYKMDNNNRFDNDKNFDYGESFDNYLYYYVFDKNMKNKVISKIVVVDSEGEDEYLSIYISYDSYKTFFLHKESKLLINIRINI